MTTRLYCVLAILATSLLCAMSLGAQLLWFLAITALLVVVFSFVTAFIGARTTRLSAGASASKLERGARFMYTLNISKLPYWPIAPLEISFLHKGVQEESFAIDTFHAKSDAIREPYTAEHVGMWDTGVARARVHDIFELFFFPVALPEKASVCVLPRPFPIEKLKLMSGEDGRALPGRAQEDLTSPEDLRAYRPGDAMKKVHWKLSARKRELLVRRFETPAPPDTLILVDCSAPCTDTPDMRDTLCETALSAARMQLQAENPVRVPFYGARSTEYQSARISTLPLLQEELARQPFMGGEAFERVLGLELRRMRRTGATVIVTSYLTPGIAQAVCNIRRMGASVRFYLVTYTPDAEEYTPCIAQMQAHLVEVCYVTPTR